MRNNKKKKKWISNILLVLKLGITGLSLFYIINKVYSDEQLNPVINSFSIFINFDWHIHLLIIIVFSMFLNWIIEAYKWKFLISKLEDISIGKSIKSVLIGLSIGIITPSRIGEFGGKIFSLEKADRKSAFLISILGSFSQLSATLFFGICGLIYYFINYIIIDNSLMLLLVSMLVILFVVLLWLFTNVSFFAKSIIKKKLFNKYSKYFAVLYKYKSKELIKVFLLSCFRFLIFTSQFYGLLYLFGVYINYFDAFMLISLSYLVLTLVPTIALADIGVRGTVSLFFLGLLSTNSSGILSASFLLWFINLALPAITGAFFVYQLKLIKEKRS